MGCAPPGPCICVESSRLLVDMVGTLMSRKGQQFCGGKIGDKEHEANLNEWEGFYVVRTGLVTFFL